MIDIGLDLRYLMCAIIAAELGSFRRTADHLDLPQSAVSRRISLLERRLGFVIFDRTRSGVRTTAAGRRFLELALPAVDQLRAAAREAVSVVKSTSGHVRVGVVAHLTSGFLSRVLMEFRRRWPKIQVILHEYSSEQILKAVSSGKVDVAITLNNCTPADYASRVLWFESVMVALPINHYLSDLKEINWSDLRDEIFIIPGGDVCSDISRCIRDRFTDLERAPQISAQDVSQASLIEMVSRGYGFTLVCSSWLRKGASNVTYRPLAGGANILATSAVWLDGSSNPNIAKLIAVGSAVRVQK